MEVRAMEDSAPEGKRSRRRGARTVVPRGLKWLDGAVLALILAAALAGLVAFGAVRFWLSGPLMMAVCLAMTLFFLRSLAYPEVLRVHWPPGFTFALLFLLYAAVRIPFSPSPYEARIEWFALFTCLGAYAVLSDVGGAGRRWKVALGAVLILITLMAWYMIIQHANGSRMVLMMERPEGYGLRASGTYHCPNHIAQILGLGMTLGLALACASGAGTPLRLLGGYALLLPVYPLALTQSRAGFIGTGVGVSVTALLLAWRKGSRTVILACVALLIVMGSAFAALWFFSPVNRERIEKAMRFDGAGRITMWENTIELIRERPVFGHGGNNFRYVQGVHQTYSGGMRARYAHNEFLHITADYGLVGFSLFALFFGVGSVRLLKRLRTMKRDRDAALAAGLLGALAAMLAHNFFDFTFHLYANALTMAAVAGVVVAVLFGDGALQPAFPPARGRRLAGVALALGCLLMATWISLSLASAWLLFPAARAHAAMEDRRAETLYRRSMRLDPGHWEPVLELAHVIRQQSFWNQDPEQRRDLMQEAESGYRRCLDLNPWMNDAHYGLSLLYNAADDPETALEELREAVRRSPRDAFFHSAIGRQLRRMGRDAEAMEAFRTALSHDPRDQAARANIRSLRRRGVR